MIDAKSYGDVGGAPRGNEVGGMDVVVESVDNSGIHGADMKGGLGCGTGDWLFWGNNGNVV